MRRSCIFSLAVLLVASAAVAEERWQVPGQEQLPDIDDVLADFEASAQTQKNVTRLSLPHPQKKDLRSNTTRFPPLRHVHTTGLHRRLTCRQGAERDRGYLQGTQSRQNW